MRLYFPINIPKQKTIKGIGICSWRWVFHSFTKKRTIKSLRNFNLRILSGSYVRMSSYLVNRVPWLKTWKPFNIIKWLFKTNWFRIRKSSKKPYIHSLRHAWIHCAWNPAKPRPFDRSWLLGSRHPNLRNALRNRPFHFWRPVANLPEYSGLQDKV
jgi:hypothetical protein